jgi:hypothetical protein
MIETTERERRIGQAAWVMAWVGVVIGQLHAMARHQTVDGKADLESAVVRAWSDPGRRLLRPLLDWASPDTVYITYGKLWLPVFVAFTLAAFVVHRRRRPTGFEKWAWRVALTCYAAASVAAFAEYWTQWGAVDYSLLDGVFLAAVPIMLLTVLSSTALGIALWRGGVRLPAVLLALALPEALAITALTSIGNILLPVAFAFGVLGRRLAVEPATAPQGAGVLTRTPR